MSRFICRKSPSVRTRWLASRPLGSGGLLVGASELHLVLEPIYEIRKLVGVF
jgi:hypothetical protein